MKTNTFLGFFVVVFLLFTLVFNYYLVVRSDEIVNNFKEPASATGRASTAVVNLCINSAPYFNMSGCNDTIYQHEDYFCNLTGVDPDNNSLTFYDAWLSNMTVFSITHDGNISFTANQTHADKGNHSVYILLSDGTDCTNGVYYELFNFTVLNVNDPPEFHGPITDVQWAQSSTLFWIYPSNYFFDPDNDPLNYTWTGNNLISISLVSNQFSLYSTSCVKETIQITATDPYNLSAVSNWINIETTCATETPGDINPGGGGGGGGGNNPPCTPDWKCYRWSECFANGTRTRKCVDQNACDPNHYIAWFTENCTYNPQYPCEERWFCADWLACLPNGTQYRACQDRNECDTVRLKPNENQSCMYIPTCFDGIQNQNETKADCGGPCKPCPLPSEEKPLPIENNVLVIALVSLILLLIILLVAYKFFHRQINELFARIGWYLSKKRKKQILITVAVKDDLLRKIAELEKEFDNKELSSLIGLYTGIVRVYYREAFKVNYEFNLAQLQVALLNRKMMYMILKKILYSFATKVADIEFGKLTIYKFELLNYIDEFKQIILQTSLTEEKDHIDQVKHRKPTTEHRYEHFYTWLANAQIALQFNRPDVAKSIYMNLLRQFERLSAKEKDRIYGDLTRLYEEIKYVGSEY
jgi:hypothetical protein